MGNHSSLLINDPFRTTCLSTLCAAAHPSVDYCYVASFNDPYWFGITFHAIRDPYPASPLCRTPRRLANQAPCAKPHDGGAERRALSERKRMNLRRLCQRLLCRKSLRGVTGAQLFFLDAREVSWAGTFFPASVRSACSAVEVVASPSLSVLAVSCASSSSRDRLSIMNSAPTRRGECRRPARTGPCTPTVVELWPFVRRGCTRGTNLHS